MDREEKFCIISDELDELSVDEQNFILWLMLKKYAERIDIPEHANDLHEYMVMTLKHNILVDCNEIIDILNYELWR